jgi:hypothetical protein
MKMTMILLSTELLSINRAGETVEPGPDGPLYITLGCTPTPEESHDGSRSQPEPVSQWNDEYCHSVTREELAGKRSRSLSR